jgi:hypothetical protein
MNVKTSIFLMLFFFGLTYCNGEEPIYDFGIKGGINVSAFESQSDNFGIQPLIGFTTSGYYSEIFYLNIEILYVKRETRLSDIVVIERVSIYSWDYSFKANYLEFFLKGGFNIIDDLSLLAGAGLAISTHYEFNKTQKEYLFDLGPTDHLEDEHKYYFTTSEDVKPWGYFSFTIGLRYTIDRYFFELNYLRNMFETTSLYDITNINSTFSSIYFTLGYNFAWQVKK